MVDHCSIYNYGHLPVLTLTVQAKKSVKEFDEAFIRKAVVVSVILWEQILCIYEKKLHRDFITKKIINRILLDV